MMEKPRYPWGYRLYMLGFSCERYGQRTRFETSHYPTWKEAPDPFTCFRRIALGLIITIFFTAAFTSVACATAYLIYYDLTTRG